MKKNFLCLMGGVLFSLPLLFASCGNGDNALEEIINGSGGGGSSTIAVTNVAIDATLRLEMNSPQTLTATISPSDATDQNVTWESTNPAVVTVNTEGKVTPVALGETTIKATVGGKSATCKVYVYDKIWNINSDGAADVPADKFWLIEGNGSEVAYSITIGAGAKATLNGININPSGYDPGISCSGDATIILADCSTNTVTVSTYEKAGIQIGGTVTTLTINAETEGTGQLTVQGGANCAGIGTSGDSPGGNIVINGGTVIATGGSGAAGIGTGVANLHPNTCGAITINGGTVTAQGGGSAAGIGTGNAYDTNTCGDITIGTGVTKVTAKRGSNATNPIGKGAGAGPQTCGMIKFGTTTVFNGTAWNPATMVDGNYDGLNLAISSGTWTLTPVAP